MKTLAKLLILLASTACVLGLAELALRLAASPLAVSESDGREKPRFNPYVASGELGYRMRPDWETIQTNSRGEFRVRVRTNALALRGGPALQRKPDGTYRVLVIGDSFAFGFGVEDDQTLPARLETELGGQPALEVLNAGVPGWGADQYFVWLRDTGLALDPDLVLVVLSGNDPDDLAWHDLELTPDGLPRRVRSQNRMIDRHGQMRYVDLAGLDVSRLHFWGRPWLEDHSRLYAWVRYRLARIQISRALSAGMEARSTDTGSGPTGAIERLGADAIQEGLSSSAAFRLRYHRFLLEQIRQLCSEHDVAFRSVHYAGRQLELPEGHLGSVMRADCAARPSVCFSSVGLFSPTDVQDFFFEHDGHPNPAGHARVARALAAWLRSDLALGLPR